MPASPIRKLMPIAADAVARGVRVIPLNIGQPDIETPPVMRERLLSLRERVLAYTPSGGTPEFLQALQSYYRTIGVDLALDQIIATTGGSEALLFAMMACADEGDEGIVFEPLYTNYRSFAMMGGVRLRAVGTSGETGFHLPPLESWRELVTERTRFILLCNPNNPTGTVYAPEELAEVARFCRDRSLFLIVDEVYREFVYDGRKTVSALSLPDVHDHVVVVDSLSKRYSACGIRLGCLVTRNQEIYSAAMRMAQGRLSAPGLAQFAATALTEVGPEYTREVVTEYQLRRDLLFEGLSSIPGVFLRKPEGAFYFIARIPVRDSDDFAQWMLQEFSHRGATVLVAPASGFYVTAGRGLDEVRIAYVLERGALQQAVDILREALPVYCRARGIDPTPFAEPPVPQPDFSLPAES